MRLSNSERWHTGNRLGRRRLLVGLASSLLAGCGGPAEPQLRVEGAWARPTAGLVGGGAEPTSAIYLVLRNTGRAADRLTAVSSDIARAAELHETTTDGGVMRMRPIAAVEVPAGGSVEFRPSGRHIMLVGVLRELQVGDHFPVTFQFERSGAITIQAEVRQG